MTIWKIRTAGSFVRFAIVAGLMGLAVFQARAAVFGQTAAGEPVEGKLAPFMGEPVFSMQELFRGGRGGHNIVTTQDGTVHAFYKTQVRSSTDGGQTWSAAREVDPEAGGAKAVVDETTGEIMLIHAKGFCVRSTDGGQTWIREKIVIRPNLLGHGADGKALDATCHQPGVTLQFGKHKGRLLVPVRWAPANDYPWRPYLYNTSIYSDDRGKTWQTSAPFPVLGTGEGTLAELSDGRIMYNSREHMTAGNRLIAWSYDDGVTWLNPHESAELPDGVRNTAYGCMGGLIRLPVKGQDILLFSNLDTPAGTDPLGGRSRMTVWVSFDGGSTWPVKRLVLPGAAQYSNLAAGRAGTPSEGKIYLQFEGGSGNQVAVFNLAWLLEGRATGDGRVPKVVRETGDTGGLAGRFVFVTPKPADLKAGDAYRLIFVTSEPIPGQSAAGGPASVADLNDWTAKVASRVPELAALNTTWTAVVGFRDKDGKRTSAIENTGTDPKLGGVPIYNLYGLRVADDYAALWGTENRRLQHPIDINERGLMVTSAGVEVLGNAQTIGKGGVVQTGATPAGLVTDRELGHPRQGGSWVTFGMIEHTDSFWIGAGNGDIGPAPVYVISGKLTAKSD